MSATKTVIPLLQGLGYRTPHKGPDSLELIRNTYGVWDQTVQADPSGNLMENVVHGAALSAVTLAAVGFLIPGLTAVEGLKWGALAGASRALYTHAFRS